MRCTYSLERTALPAATAPAPAFAAFFLDAIGSPRRVLVVGRTIPGMPCKGTAFSAGVRRPGPGRGGAAAAEGRPCRPGGRSARGPARAPPPALRPRGPRARTPSRGAGDRHVLEV